jgi:hypothetical protein
MVEVDMHEVSVKLDNAQFEAIMERLNALVAAGDEILIEVQELAENAYLIFDEAMHDEDDEDEDEDEDEEDEDYCEVAHAHFNGFVAGVMATIEALSAEDDEDDE